ncbi:MAG: NAD(P)H-hydrate dehydratase [Candidatus Omnitrophica bacterium]|nr:NAD(P)H-hydrate dehydratase [Candidatus Omnitrophota bacterium]
MKNNKAFNTEFLKRKNDAHKGDFGHVFIIAGSKGLTGAAVLCVKGALLSGAGLVTLGIAQSQYAIASRKLTEAMTLPLLETSQGSLSLKAFSQIKKFSKDKDVLAIGPGLSRNKSTQSLVRKIISSIDIPMVIDADGLNALKGHLDILKKRRALTVITPHPGEMGCILGRKTSYIQKNRRILAKQLAGMYNIITVLKGHGTIVAEPKGKVFENCTGNPGMAKGGSGDVLTGITAAFLGQSGNAYEAAKLAVYVHGLAADLAVKQTGQVSLLATDILNKLPIVLKKLSGEVK